MGDSQGVDDSCAGDGWWRQRPCWLGNDSEGVGDGCAGDGWRRQRPAGVAAKVHAGAATVVLNGAGATVSVDGRRRWMCREVLERSFF
jgi:hypothetical protein